MPGKNGQVAPFPDQRAADFENVVAIPAEWTDVAAALCKHHKIHEGLWRVAVHFGDIAAVNGRLKLPGHDAAVPVPMAMVPVLKLFLKRSEQPDELTVDAAVVNPRPSLIHAPFFQ